MAKKALKKKASMELLKDDIEFSFIEEEKDFLKQFNFGYEVTKDLPDEQGAYVWDRIAKYLVLYCFDEDYRINHEGILCESILDKIANELGDDDDEDWDKDHVTVYNYDIECK